MGQLFRAEYTIASSAIDPAAMAERVTSFAPATDAEALRILRASFPDSPLRMRVAALDFLMRRRKSANTAHGSR